MGLLSINADAKTMKSNAKGEYLTAILYLAPASTSGRNICPSATAGCKASCLFTAGRGKMHNVQEARIRKTRMYFEDRDTFRATLYKEFVAFSKRCDKLKVKPAVRLNGTSDVEWYSKFPELYTDFPNIMLYGYTKVEKVMNRYMDGKYPDNYYLTFSRSENNWNYCTAILNKGFTVSAVFIDTPNEYKGYEVLDGDLTDMRFLDKPGCIIGLKAKGKAKKDKTGFVIR